MSSQKFEPYSETIQQILFLLNDVSLHYTPNLMSNLEEINSILNIKFNKNNLSNQTQQSFNNALKQITHAELGNIMTCIRCIIERDLPDWIENSKQISIRHKNRIKFIAIIFGTIVGIVLGTILTRHYLSIVNESFENLQKFIQNQQICVNYFIDSKSNHHVLKRHLKKTKYQITEIKL